MRAVAILAILGSLVLAGAIFAPAAQASPQRRSRLRTSSSRAAATATAVGLSQWGAWQGAREGNSYRPDPRLLLSGHHAGATSANAESTIVKVRVSSKPWTSNTTSFSQVDLRAGGLARDPPPVYVELRLRHGDHPVGESAGMVNSGGQVAGDCRR